MRLLTIQQRFTKDQEIQNIVDANLLKDCKNLIQKTTISNIQLHWKYLPINFTSAKDTVYVIQLEYRGWKPDLKGATPLLAGIWQCIMNLSLIHI